MISLAVDLVDMLRIFVGMMLFILAGLLLYGTMLLGAWLYVRLRYGPEWSKKT